MEDARKLSSVAVLCKDHRAQCPGRQLRARRGSRGARRPRVLKQRVAAEPAAPPPALRPARRLEDSSPAPDLDPAQRAQAAAEAARAFLRRLGGAAALAAEAAAAAEAEKAAEGEAVRASGPHPAGSLELGLQRQRRVRFNLDAITRHEVVPYSEIYGLHPSEFVFDRDFYLVPSNCRFGFVGMPTGVSEEESGSESEEEEEEEQDAGHDGQA
uniref:Uncharacterized protein n=1 Tax=Alexandrium monilatum TaxID=311494 RepID=A0A7S4SBH1_9DINO